MSTRIGLISDLHATVAPLKEALSIFQQHSVDLILCPGDIVGYGEEEAETVELLSANHCRTILGNHEIWYLDEHGENSADQTTHFMRDLPLYLELDIEDKNVYMVHASPPASYMNGIKLLDENGDILTEEKSHWAAQLAEFDYDVLIVGHTHQVFAEQIANTLVINPGSTKFNHTCAILELPGLSCEFFPLSGETPLKSWNWGQYFAQQNNDPEQSDSGTS